MHKPRLVFRPEPAESGGGPEVSLAESAVADFYGLSDRQKEHASIFLGGSGAAVTRINTPDAISPEAYGRIAVAVFGWGYPHATEVLWKMCVSRPTSVARTVVILDDTAYDCSVIRKQDRYYDDGLDDFIFKDFRPREEFSRNVVVLPWEPEQARAVLDVLVRQQLRHPIFIELPDFYLQYQQALLPESGSEGV